MLSLVHVVRVLGCIPCGDHSLDAGLELDDSDTCSLIKLDRLDMNDVRPSC